MRREPSGGRTMHTVQMMAGREVVLDVRRSRARLIIINKTTHELWPRVGDRNLSRLGPGASFSLEDLPPGRHKLHAFDADGNLTHLEHRELLDGETGHWQLRGDAPEPDTEPAGAVIAPPSEEGPESNPEK